LFHLAVFRAWSWGTLRGEERPNEGESAPPPPAAAGGGEATSPVDYRPLTFSPVNPYTVSPEVMPIVNDERIRGICTWFVRANANVKGRPNMKASDFQRWVNTFLIPNHLSQLRPYRARVLTYNSKLVTPEGAPASRAYRAAETLDEAIADADKTWAISLTTAKRWLFHLGFRKTTHRKTMYVDGHERDDVVKDRKSKCHRFVTDAVDREVNRMAAEQTADEERPADAAGEAPPLIGRGVADMAAVGALGDDDDD